MPTLEVEIGVAVILAVTAGAALLVSNKSAGDDTEFNALLLLSILLQSTIPALWSLFTALRLTESYTRWRVPPLRSYWAGAFHTLGAAALTTALGTFVVLFLHVSDVGGSSSSSGGGGRRFHHQQVHDIANNEDDEAMFRYNDYSGGGDEGEGTGSRLGGPVIDVVAVVALLVAVGFVGARSKQRDMDPETDVVRVGEDVRYGWVARGHRVRFWWMYGVANWFRRGGGGGVGEGKGRLYELNWMRHWKTEPVVDAGTRTATLQEISHAEVGRLRYEFWFVLLVYVLINGCFLKLFWCLE